VDYKLAKQLKNAGYNQHPKRGPHGGEFIQSASGDEIVCGPCLEELIEACGDDFFQLTKGSDVWYAGADIATEPDKVFGSTPTEAVAKLWLVSG
jgi:hypothetical protein